MIYDRSSAFRIWSDESGIATHMRLATKSYYIWYRITDDGFTTIEDGAESDRLEAEFKDGDYKGDAS